MELNEWVMTLAAVARAVFAGLSWYSGWKSRKRNNPPSHDSKTDRFISQFGVFWCVLETLGWCLRSLFFCLFLYLYYSQYQLYYSVVPCITVQYIVLRLYFNHYLMSDNFRSQYYTVEFILYCCTKISCNCSQNLIYYINNI